MKIINTRGSLGDAYITACCLAGVNDNLLINHYTKIVAWQPQITDIYSLLPKATVNFVDKPRFQFIWGTNEAALCNPFPDFSLPTPRGFLPEEYNVLVPQSGKPLRFEKGRSMTQEEVNKAIRNSNLPVVVLGVTHGRPKTATCKGTINLMDKTTLLEAAAIVSKAKTFIGFQGFLTYVALSYKISSQVYVNGDAEWKAFTSRMFKSWLPYCKSIQMRNGAVCGLPDVSKLHGK